MSKLFGSIGNDYLTNPLTLALWVADQKHKSCLQHWSEPPMEIESVRKYSPLFNALYGDNSGMLRLAEYGKAYLSDILDKYVTLTERITCLRSLSEYWESKNESIPVWHKREVGLTLLELKRIESIFQREGVKRMISKAVRAFIVHKKKNRIFGAKVWLGLFATF